MKWSSLDRPSYFGLTRRRLQTLYLVAAAGLASLVPLILFAGFWIRSELGKSQRDVDAFLRTRALTLSQRVDADIEQQLAALRALSALPSLDGDVSAFEEAARRMSGVMNRWACVMLIQAGSDRPVFSSGPGPNDPPSAALIAKARADRKPVIESRAASATKGGGILLYFPIVRNDVAGAVIVAMFDAADIQDIVVQEGVASGLQMAVTDEHNFILARSTSPERFIGQEASSRFRQETSGRPNGIFRSESLDNEPIASAFVRSTFTGWVAVAAIDRRQSDSLLTRSAWATIAAGGLSLVLAGILAVFIIHTIMERRVSDERLSASRALGDLDARLLATTQEALGEQRKAASEREVLLREIYHRVKNNLQIVQSLLRLGSRDLKADQREPFESAVRRIGAMARVHTLLYNSPDLASIDFKDYLDELLKELSDGFGAEERSIAPVLDAETMRMPLDMAVPLAFIAVEILTNAFKHAFPDGRSGTINVEVGRDDGEATLRIRDDGIGMTYDQSGKRRLGLTIVRKLVQQIGGTLEEPPPGQSTFVIRFPVDGPASAPSNDDNPTALPLPA